MREIDLSSLSRFSVGGEHSDAEIPAAGLLPEHIVIYRQKDGWNIKAKGEVFLGGTPVTEREIRDGEIFILNKEKGVMASIFLNMAETTTAYPLTGHKSISIGRNAGCDISIDNKRVSGKHCRITEDGGRWLLEDSGSTNGTYVNGRLEKRKILEESDVISIERYDLILKKESLLLRNMKKDTCAGAHPVSEHKTDKKEYPYFKRSPRLKYEIPIGEVNIQAPPSIGSKPEINWISVFLPPIATILASVAFVLVLQTSVNMLIYSVPLVGVGVMVSLLNYSSQKKKHGKAEQARLEAYNDHLLQVSQELDEAVRKQMKALLAAHPETGKCPGIVSALARRLWERKAQDEDFMALRLGSGAVDASVQIKTPHNAITIEKDSLLQKPYEVAERYKSINGAPITLAFLKNCTAGIIGDRRSIIALTKNMLVQAATHHCYTELKIIVLFPKAETKEWDFVKWLPHTFSDGRMGTTVALLCVFHGKIHLYNIGDSRIYHFRRGKLEQLSEDHTPVFCAVKMGLMTKEQARKHPHRSKLTQHLGIAEKEMIVKPFRKTVKPKENDVFLLCSDGLTDMVDDAGIENMLRLQNNADGAVKALIDTALENGGRDNICIILIKLEKKKRGRMSAILTCFRKFKLQAVFMKHLCRATRRNEEKYDNPNN
jgi:S-DNA-T family DNA segregation ATPase FtsK/SpoIIIE